MWDFQKHEMQSLSVNKDFHMRCYDSIEPLTGFRLPRGQGGVSILWPTHLPSKVKKLDDGNEGIIGIELLGTNKMCIINVYLPTNNASVNSYIEYGECLDILDNMISKFRNSHKVYCVGTLMVHCWHLDHIITMINSYMTL